MASRTPPGLPAAGSAQEAATACRRLQVPVPPAAAWRRGRRPPLAAILPCLPESDSDRLAAILPAAYLITPAQPFRTPFDFDAIPTPMPFRFRFGFDSDFDRLATFRFRCNRFRFWSTFLTIRSDFDANISIFDFSIRLSSTLHTSLLCLCRSCRRRFFLLEKTHP